MRGIIAQTTSSVCGKVPHYSVVVEIDVTKSMKIINEMRKAKITDLIIYGSAQLLRKYEYLNGFWGDDDSVNLYEQVNIGYVVAVDDGILIPVLRDADKLGIGEIYNIRKRLVQKTLNHKLLPDEYKGGTFTISNLGILPVDHFTGILYPNQAGLLTMGKISDGHILKITLVCDHRMVDGYYAAKFLAELKEFSEDESRIIRIFTKG